MAESADKHRARARQAKTTADLIGLCAEIYAAAMTREKSYYSKDGELRVVDEPDLRAAANTVDLIGKLLGVLGDGKTMDKATLERELDRMGYRLEPKMKRVG